MLYRPNSEHARLAEEYAADFEKREGEQIEMISLDTREGSDKAQLYGITRYPAILATREDGQMLNMWQGGELPLMDEVAAYQDSQELPKTDI